MASSNDFNLEIAAQAVKRGEMERLLFCMNVREAKYEDTYIKQYTIILKCLVLQMQKKLVRCCQVWEKLEFVQTEKLLGR